MRIQAFRHDFARRYAMMVINTCSTGEGDPEENMAALFGPAQVDHTIRQAIQFCWMALPKESRNPEEMERQIRRLVDRALRDFKEGSEAFGRPN